MLRYTYGNTVNDSTDKKISTTVYLTRTQLEKLKLLHERTKVPVAEFVRQGIDLVLRQNADKLPGQLSLPS